MIYSLLLYEQVLVALVDTTCRLVKWWEIRGGGEMEERYCRVRSVRISSHFGTFLENTYL
jgi:hypothetical protein